MPNIFIDNHNLFNDYHSLRLFVPQNAKISEFSAAFYNFKASQKFVDGVPPFSNFLSFISDSLGNPSKPQTNNHYLMRAIIKKFQLSHKVLRVTDFYKFWGRGGVESHVQLIDHLKKLKPDNFFSNKLITSDTEKLLSVGNIESKFISIVNSAGCSYDAWTNSSTIDIATNYFAMQIARGVICLEDAIDFLMGVLDPPILATDTVKEIDLLNYLFVKHGYNNTVIQFNAGLQQCLKDHSFVYKIQSPLSTTEIVFSDFCTFYIKDFVSKLMPQFCASSSLLSALITLVPDNGFIVIAKSKLTTKDFECLCYLIKKCFNEYSIRSALEYICVPEEETAAVDYPQINKNLSYSFAYRSRWLREFIAQSQKHEAALKQYCKNNKTI